MTKRKPPLRVLIVGDGEGSWFVRRVSTITHDLDSDEKVYRCDLPIGTRCNTLDEAVSLAKLVIERNAIAETPQPRRSAEQPNKGTQDE